MVYSIINYFSIRKINMKIFISADIEGVTGAADWNETDKAHADYSEFREQMTAEVVAACEGAIKAGAQEVWVRDAHDSARNIIAAKLPPEALKAAEAAPAPSLI